MSKESEKEQELPVPWQRIQGAIWLIGLAVIALQGWWWPGILVLAGISGLTQGVIQLYLKRQEEERARLEAERQAMEARGKWLPPKCPNCGGPLSVSTVKWTGPNTADCPFCNANIKEPSGS